MCYVVLVYENEYPEINFFSGFNAACRYADKMHEMGYQVFMYKNIGFSRIYPFFVLQHNIFDGYLIQEDNYPPHIDLIFRALHRM